MTTHDTDDLTTDTGDPRPASGYRTYEVYQRERVGDSSNLLTNRELIGDEMLSDPYRLLTLLREHHPCYRDWTANRFWVTRYDDVTSLLVDRANFETRPKRQRMLDPERLGRDLHGNLSVEWAIANRTDEALGDITTRIIDDLRGTDRPDLARELAARLPMELWAAVLDLPEASRSDFATRFWRMQRGAGWDPSLRRDGVDAFDELVEFFEPLVERRRRDPGDDMISAIAGLELDDGPAGAGDLVTTLLDSDHETLHGGLANLWFNLLTLPAQFDAVRSEPRLMKFAWLETLRHSPPVHSVQRFARHEVERFGRLLPDGALMQLSAAAANRDPRVFDDPDRFIVGRSDLCQREPRGQYRADGLPSGIAPALGTPSIHPAVPRERPRSMYALTRDVAVHVSARVLDAFPGLRLAPGAEPMIRSLRLGEMHTCWHLPVEL